MSKDIQPIKFKGELRWASIPPAEPRPPIKPRKGEEDDRTYSVMVECTEEMYKKLIKAGIDSKWKLRDDEDKEGKILSDKKFVNIRASKIKGEYVFDDPWVIDHKKKPVTDLVGNGSVGIVIADLVRDSTGAVLRLKGVQVLDLIPYEPDNSPEKYNDLLEGDADNPYADLEDDAVWADEPKDKKKGKSDVKVPDDFI